MPRYNVHYWVSGWGNHHSYDFEAVGTGGNMIAEAASAKEAKKQILDQNPHRTILKVEPCPE